MSIPTDLVQRVTIGALLGMDSFPMQHQERIGEILQRLDEAIAKAGTDVIMEEGGSYLRSEILTAGKELVRDFQSRCQMIDEGMVLPMSAEALATELSYNEQVMVKSMLDMQNFSGLSAEETLETLRKIGISEETIDRNTKKKP